MPDQADISETKVLISDVTIANPEYEGIEVLDGFG
jgi:hypothetical protein